MSLIADLASSTSLRLFGPPAPVSKDPQPLPLATNTKPTPPQPTSPSSVSRKAVLLSPNLGLDLSPRIMPKSKADELPLPPPPEEPQPAGASVASIGVSALSLLGSAVVSLGSVAVSAMSSSSAPSESPAAIAKPSEQEKEESKAEETLLGSISNAVLGRAASLRDAAIDSVTETASALATSAAHAITDTASATFSYATAKSTPISTSADPTVPPNDQETTRTIRRASTLPIQLTATGEPFSSNPSISAMQRIPDHPCRQSHAHHRNGLVHCCSAPDVLANVNEEREECSCKCYAVTLGDENPKVKGEQGCTCHCHQKAAYIKGDSGHFHRVEQLVKGTKRVVRDIKNVL
ncbi:uncharacterized protein UTRI_05014_B [Ustilago trichophora]|uniref:Uncharacterized protein n=1 Tax=Ustilago trichophora TaxID=86804 RepID=A0A5C3EI77_9BASI|nr:uncharacterized protein UTRI_05014_B [Ustilago trichophora]